MNTNIETLKAELDFLNSVDLMALPNNQQISIIARQTMLRAAIDGFEATDATHAMVGLEEAADHKVFISFEALNKIMIENIASDLDYVAIAKRVETDESTIDYESIPDSYKYAVTRLAVNSAMMALNNEILTVATDKSARGQFNQDGCVFITKDDLAQFIEPADAH